MERQFKLPVLQHAEPEEKDQQCNPLLEAILAEEDPVDVLLARVELRDSLVREIEECIDLFKKYLAITIKTDSGLLSYREENAAWEVYNKKIYKYFPTRIISYDKIGAFALLSDGKKLRPVCKCGKYSFCKIVSYRIEP